MAGAIVLGALSGAFGGGVVADLVLSPRLDRLADRLAHTTSTEPVQPPVVIVPLENRPILPSYPQAFLDGHVSQVVGIVHRLRSANEESTVPDDRWLGSGALVTSDGWVLTDDASIASFKLADLGIAHGGRVYPLTRGVRDLSTSFVFLKFTASNLPVASFARASDVTSGAAVWVEQKSGVLAPDVIADASWQSSSAISSERAGRRFVLASKGYAPGSAVWDSGGRLIGLVEGPSDASSHVIPADSSGNFLSAFLFDGTVNHASLGLRIVDLSGLTFDTVSSTIPALGSWVRIKGTASGSKAVMDGDVIERIERDILDGTADLGERLLDYRPGAEVTLSILRKSQSIQVKAVLGTWNAADPLK